MDAILAATENWGIGKDNRLLLSIPDDMKFFREKTKGAVVIMGRATLESFPNAAPLKGRVNIVITRNRDYSADGAIVVHDIRSAVKEAEKYTAPVFVIGGESIYRAMLDMCENVYVTKMFADIPADRFFPNLDELPEWELCEESERFEHEGVGYCFTRYGKRAQK